MDAFRFRRELIDSVNFATRHVGEELAVPKATFESTVLTLQVVKEMESTYPDASAYGFIDQPSKT